MGMSTVDKSESGFTSENEDPWDIETETEEEEDEIHDDGLLTMLVRRSYLKHLERSLKKNYEDSLIKEQIPPAELSEVIAHHAKFLEKRALRSSMRVGVYQRYMVKAIEEIKQATKKNKIHPTFTRRKYKKREKIEKETQTEEISKPNEETSKPDEKTEMQNMLSSAFGFSPGAPGAHEGIDSYEELLNILTASPNLLKDDHDVTLDLTNGRVCESPKPRMNLDERLQLLGLMGDDDVAPVSRPKPNLDERLQLLGLMEDDDDAPVSHPQKNLDASASQDSFEEPPCKMRKVELPTDWKRELVVQEELMESILHRKSPFMRALIERRFKDLFGVDVEVAFVPALFPVPVPAPMPVPVLMVDSVEAQDELLLARRHVAGHVVKALTPYYVQGRIGSRLVFKSLAKKITDRLLSKTMTPDPKDAKKEVKICFALQSEILSSKDIDRVFSSLGY